MRICRDPFLIKIPEDNPKRNKQNTLKKPTKEQNRKAVLAKYGLTFKTYEDLLKKQNYSCAICGTKTPTKRGFHIDHCHTSNKVRGLLCHHCNTGLGNFKDNIALLYKAGLYLKNSY